MQSYALHSGATYLGWQQRQEDFTRVIREFMALPRGAAPVSQALTGYVQRVFVPTPELTWWHNRAQLQPFPFLRLPYELRQDIYGQIFQGATLQYQLAGRLRYTAIRVTYREIAIEIERISFRIAIITFNVLGDHAIADKIPFLDHLQHVRLLMSTKGEAAPAIDKAIGQNTKILTENCPTLASLPLHRTNTGTLLGGNSPYEPAETPESVGNRVRTRLRQFVLTVGHRTSLPIKLIAGLCEDSAPGQSLQVREGFVKRGSRNARWDVHFLDMVA